MSKKSNHESKTIFQAGVLKIDDVGNINAGGGNIDNASVMQTETMSVGTAHSNVVMQWDGECLCMNATEGMVRMSGLAEPKDGCDAVTKDYADGLADRIADEVMAKVMQRLQSGKTVKF